MRNENGSILKRTIPDFNLKKIAASGQCFRMKEESPGQYLVISGKKALRLRQEENAVAFYCGEEEYDTYWQTYFDLDTDYGSVWRSVDPEDTYLKSAVRSAAGVRILRQELFETIITFIISQQNNIPRIRKCVENLCAGYGERKSRPGIGEYLAFPEAEALAGAREEDLKACNLGYRARYVLKTSAQIAEGMVSLSSFEKMTDAEAKAQLLLLTGVGEKVADCVLLFALHRVDAFPVDTHIRQVLEKYYPQGFPLERYRGHAGIMQQAIFYGEVAEKEQTKGRL